MAAQLTYDKGKFVIITMKVKVSDYKHWKLIQMDGRVDAFNHEGFKERVQDVANQAGTNLVVDLQPVKFLSLPTIKFLCSLAQELNRQGRALALLSPSEKQKRQFDIFASLDDIRIAKTLSDLDSTGLREKVPSRPNDESFSPRCL